MNLTFDSYNDIGRYLRECRESLHLTTRGISEQIHIRAKYLDALETAQLSDIPGTVYIKGYLAAYAEFLGLNKKEIIKSFEKLGKPPHRRKIFLSIPTSKENIPDRGLTLFSLLFVLALCIVWWLVRPGTLPQREVSDVPASMLHRYQPRQADSMLLVWRPECSLAYEDHPYPFCDDMSLEEGASIARNRQRHSIIEAW